MYIMYNFHDEYVHQLVEFDLLFEDVLFVYVIYLNNVHLKLIHQLLIHVIIDFHLLIEVLRYFLLLLLRHIPVLDQFHSFQMKLMVVVYRKYLKLENVEQDDQLQPKYN
jgi:hypothetical protein